MDVPIQGPLVSHGRVRRKIWWLYHYHFIYRWLAAKGRRSLRFYQALYPNLNVGGNPQIWGDFHMVMHDPYDSRISIGHNLHMVSDYRRAGITLHAPCQFTTMGNGEILIGNDVQINGAAITSKKRVRIGDGTLIAPNCIIVDSDFHAPWPPENRRVSSTSGLDEEVSIGNNVWLGLNVVVLKGVVIGDNSIIGAGSVVANNIAANVVAVGNPAKMVKPLKQ
jgi:acetyltransferase-like isoleucine patch superfamily enzyme